MSKGAYELDHHSDASHACVLDGIGDVCLDVALLQGPRRVPQLGVALHLHGVRLAVAHVPVQHVELGVWQRVDDLADGCERLEMPRRVNHEPEK